jgi:CheY-like chemotaxis protein
MKVLIVEDNMSNQLLLEYYLKGLGYEYKVASNGEQALNKFKDQGFDMVLMDVEMPVMNGIEATKHIRLLDQKVPIIAVSAYVEGALMDKCQEVGMNDFVRKPYKKKEILQVIDSNMNRIACN